MQVIKQWLAIGLILCVSIPYHVFAMNGSSTVSLTKQHSFHGNDSQDFANKVDDYIKQIWALPGSKEHGDMQKLLNAISAIHKNSPSDDLVRVLSDVKKIEPSQLQEGDQSIYNQFQCALLIKASLPFSLSAKKIILTILSMLDGQIAYWEYQQSHLAYYFLHKSPVQWFSGQTQRREIEEKLKVLRCVQNEHFKVLGELMVHLDKFVQKGSVSQQYVWLGQLLSIINHLCTGQMLEEQVLSYDHLLPSLRSLAEKVEQHEDYIDKQIVKDVKKPHYLVRNWIRSVVGFASVIAAGSYVYNNKDEIPGKLKRAQDNFYSKVIAGPVKSLRETFLEDPNKKSENDVIQEDLGKLKDIAPKFKQGAGKILDELQKSENNGGVTGWFKGKVSDAMLSPGKRQNLKTIADSEFWPPVNEACNILEKHSDRLLGSSNEILENVNRIFKQNRALIAGISLAPAMALLYGGFIGVKKVYKRIKGKPNYEPLRTAVIDIAHILNLYGDVHPRDMVAQDYGRLVYLGHTLRKNKCLVPEGKRRRYLSDIAKLTSAQLPAYKKMKVVDLMYKNYDFLHPTFVAR